MSEVMSQQGYIKTVRVDRGFGFISCRTAEKDIFFHVADCEPGLMFDESLEGLRVEFEVTQGDKGLAARNVRAAR